MYQVPISCTFKICCVLLCIFFHKIRYESEWQENIIPLVILLTLTGELQSQPTTACESKCCEKINSSRPGVWTDLPRKLFGVLIFGVGIFSFSEKPEKNIHNKNISVGKYTIFSDKLVTILTKASENGYVWISIIYFNFNLNTFFFKSKVKEPPLKGLHRGLVV